MIYFLGMIETITLGTLALYLLKEKKSFSWPQDLLLGMCLGFGLNGMITFIFRLCLENPSPFIAPLVSLTACGILIYLNPDFKPSILTTLKNLPAKSKQTFHKIIETPTNIAALLLGLLGLIVICLEANRYPMGGWDAWSCWNLKSKFIYLAGDNYKTMFDPELWRSNTQYPLLLPCINVWFFDLSGGIKPWIPMVNSIIFYCLSALTLAVTLYQNSKIKYAFIALPAAIYLLPLNVTLGISQYSDVLVGLFLLGAFICFINDEIRLTAVFLGLLAFTKTEGLAAAGILSALLCVHERRKLLVWIGLLGVCMSPTLYFQAFVAPSNEAFINGFTSLSQPSTWARLQVILIAPFLELISLKWAGLWLILSAGLALLFAKELFNKKARISFIFFALFIGVLVIYYQVNTYFEIAWWISTTLHRILFALLPSIALWIALVIRPKNIKKAS